MVGQSICKGSEGQHQRALSLPFLGYFRVQGPEKLRHKGVPRSRLFPSDAFHSVFSEEAGVQSGVTAED